MVTLELLPQLVPLFLCPPDQRGDYGSSIPPAAPSATHPARSAFCKPVLTGVACLASVAPGFVLSCKVLLYLSPGAQLEQRLTCRLRRYSTFPWLLHLTCLLQFASNGSATVADTSIDD